MFRSRHRWLLALLLCALPRTACGVITYAVNNTFEIGPTIDSTFTSGGNWVSSFGGLTAHSGAQFFESDNGNQAHDFVNERYAKSLGGVIQHSAYDASFFIAPTSSSRISRACNSPTFLRLPSEAPGES